MVPSSESSDKSMISSVLVGDPFRSCSVTVVVLFAGDIAESMKQVITLENIKMQMDAFHQMAGSISDELGQHVSSSLTEQTLSMNGLTGTTPFQFCLLKQDGTLDNFLSTDCDKVLCNCCAECCFDDLWCILGMLDPTPGPTDRPTIAKRPVATPTNLPTR